MYIVTYFKLQISGMNDYAKKGIEFEKRCIERLEELGLQNVFKTPESNDFGADIVAYFNNIKYVFQCKDHAKTPGENAVREIYGSKNIYNANVCAVISSSGFTPKARDLAKANYVLLLTANDLFKSENFLEILEDAVANFGKTDVVTYDYNIIREFYKRKRELGYTPTLPQLGKTLKYKILKAYGNYTKFLTAIDETVKRSKPTSEMLRNEYIRIRTLLGRTPTANDIKSYTKLPYNQFHQYPLTKLQKECGDIPNCDRSTTKEDLIKEYLELEKRLGHKPNGSEIDKNGKHGSHLYIKKFGSLTAFYSLPEISATELLNEPLTQKEIIAYYLMLKLIFKRRQIPLNYTTIRTLSCGKYKPFPISAIEHKFKNFTEFCQLLENNGSVKDLEVHPTNEVIIKHYAKK